MSCTLASHNTHNLNHVPFAIERIAITITPSVAVVLPKHSDSSSEDLLYTHNSQSRQAVNTINLFLTASRYSILVLYHFCLQQILKVNDVPLAKKQSFEALISLAFNVNAETTKATMAMEEGNSFLHVLLLAFDSNRIRVCCSIGTGTQRCHSYKK
jgi:hypothetical protein